MTKRNLVGVGASLVLTTALVTAVAARPPYLQAFKTQYNTASGKPKLNMANCALCHDGAPNSGKWNPYGEELRKALGAKNVQDKAKLTAAFQAIESKKRTPNARRNYGQLIAADTLPGAAQMAAQPNRPATQPPAATGGGAAGRVEVAGDWEYPFNGVNMDGLVKMNQGEWSVSNGILRYKANTGNGWLRTAKQYKNYAAVLVWKFPNAGNNDAGFFLRAGLTGNPWPSSPQLNMGPGTNMGSIGGMAATRARPDLIKANDWNTYEVTVKDGAVSVAINGVAAWEGIPEGFPNSQPGYLGIQCENFALEVAHFAVRPLR